MPRSLASLLTLPLLTLALGLVACGEDDAQLLPGGTAREITANLDTVQQLSDEGDCVGAESAAQQVGEQIEALEGVDRKLKQALEDGAARLEEVIVECEESTTESVAPAEIPPEDEEEDEDGDEKEKPKPDEDDEGPDTPTTSPSLPPQANGEGKGLENGNSPPPSEEEAPEEGGAESPSGGVSPGSPASKGDGGDGDD